jgi:hypothetical protein
VFGSVCLYLYTRIQQTETKINLLESIILDLKMTNELKAYPNIPSPAYHHPAQEFDETVIEMEDVSGPLKPFVDEDEEAGVESAASAVPLPDSTLAQANAQAEALPNVDAPVQAQPPTTQSKASVNYEAMTLKELQAVAKERGVSGTSTMRRAQVIQALKHSDDTHVHVLDALIEADVSSSA